MGIKQDFNLYQYKNLQKEQAESPQSMAALAKLVDHLLVVSSCAKIKYKALQQSFVFLMHEWGASLLKAHWDMDEKLLAGRAADAVGVLLKHWRKVASSEAAWQKATSKLDEADTQTLWRLRKKATFEEEKGGARRKLEVKVSEVSMDSKGFARMTKKELTSEEASEEEEEEEEEEGSEQKVERLLLALQKGYPNSPEKGAENMAAASSAAQPERRNKKPLWVDVALAAEEKAIAKGVESTTGHEKPKEENQEPEQEEWWEQDWKKGGKDWDSWWQEKQREWDEWKKEERAQEKEQNRAWPRNEDKQKWTKLKEEEDKAKAKEEEEEDARKERDRDLARHIEETVRSGSCKRAEWTNRNGSSKEAAKKRWATRMAEESGQDSELARLGAIGQSRLRRLINRQQDRLTQKETVEKAEQAAAQAAQAALAAQSAS
eukprot:symbB.v1.2.041556.t1/scaffold8342.1/size6759/1